LSRQMKTILKKCYGQHFLRDTGIINRIIALIDPKSDDLMIEVGGGDGALSTRLAPRVFRLLAVEIDHDMIPALTDALAPFSNAEVVARDVLQIDLAEIIAPHLSSDVRLRLVGNLPYNIGTAVIEKMILQPLPIENMTFMLQLETAERLCAAAGSKAYGFFSVFCQHYCKTKMGFKVSPACFVPRPNVDSAMITMQRRSGSHDPDFEKDFLFITKAAFAYRRKKLSNSLLKNSLLDPISCDILDLAGIDGARRAGDLSVSEYEHLARAYHDYRVAHRLPGNTGPSL
jgi:16S rRNA (adenine1518-N6/adenine1519-N6)-dimethyltransferase